MPMFVMIDTGLANLAFGEARSVITTTANATTTFAAMAVSAAAANRFIAVAVLLDSDQSIPVTVNGHACTKVIGINNGAFFAEVWITNAAEAAGTTLDVVLTGTHTTNIRVAVATYALYGILNPTAPSSTGSDITSTYDIPLVIPAGGVAIACANIGVLTSWTWSSFTENADAQISPMTYTAASRTLAGSFTETVTPAAGGSAAFVAAAWSPA